VYFGFAVNFDDELLFRVSELGAKVTVGGPLLDYVLGID